MMTEQEAIKAIEHDLEWHSKELQPKYTKVLRFAIKVLEEIQQYRALEEKLNGISVEQVVNGFISTVEKQTHEEYKRGRILTNKEADEWNELQAIGTIGEFKALKEKNEPKIPNYEGDGYYAGQIVLDTWICPNCEKAYEVDYEDYEYCPNCGQHIDHSSLTEDD